MPIFLSIGLASPVENREELYVVGSKMKLGTDRFNNVTRWVVSGTLLPFPETLIVVFITAFSRGEPFVLFRRGGGKAQDDPEVRHLI